MNQFSQKISAHCSEETFNIGSSYLPGELLAAFLYAQLENMDLINTRRKKIYETYYQELKPLEEDGFLQLPTIPKHCQSNYHLFYIILKSEKVRDNLINYLRSKNISAVFHFLPLHLSPIGRSLGYKDGQLPATESVSGRLLRLPFYYELTTEDQERVIKIIKSFYQSKRL